jgi:formylglycine-generating enzyme required for sulfatase activity
MRRRLWTAAAMGVAVWFAGCGKNTPTPPPVSERPPVPEWANVAATAPGAITLQWTDVAQNEAGYVVERSLNAANGYASVATLDANVQEYVDASVTAGVRYYYRILTRDTLGRLSDPTPAVWGDAIANASPTLPVNPSPPNKGFDLDLPHLVTLTWAVGDPDGPAPQSTVYFGEARNALALVAADLTTASYSLTDTLALTRFYFWRVVAIDDHGATAISPIWSFGTHMERLQIPAGPFALGDCGTFYAADPTRFCAPTQPAETAAYNMDKYEVSNQLFSQFLNELLEEKYVHVMSGAVASLVGDTIFAQVYPLGDEHSGIEFIPYGVNTGLFLPRSGRENHPVIEVSWFGAERFARHFGRRLPTEREWEKAARGTSSELGWARYLVGAQPESVGIGFPFPWGAGTDPHNCNFLASGDPFEARVGVGTTPVGFYDGRSHSGYATRSNQSPYGVYDLAGNVSEWCDDWFGPYTGGGTGNLKTIRGGGWRSRLSSCQTFWREGVQPDSTDNLVGFRTVASE